MNGKEDRMTQYTDTNRFQDSGRSTAENLRERTKRFAGPVLERVRDTTSRVRTNVQANPRPYLYSVGAVIGGALLMSFLIRNLWTRRREV